MAGNRIDAYVRCQFCIVAVDERRASMHHCQKGGEMRYEVCGPFDSPRFSRDAVGAPLTSFWDDVEYWAEGLSRAVGVYVFSIRHGSKFTPWYVGKTCAQTGFRGEIFQSHKLGHYIAASEMRRGSPTLHLVARVDPNRDRFSKPSQVADRDIDALETAMIGMALRANPSVRNARKTWFIRNCRVPGIMGEPLPGRRPEAATTLRRALAL